LVIEISLYYDAQSKKQKIRVRSVMDIHGLLFTKFGFFVDVFMNCWIAKYESELLWRGLHEIEFLIT
jgi:hypothetical protein